MADFKNSRNSSGALWKTDSNSGFINPYTFIPPHKVIKTDCTNRDGNLTGYLECSIHVKTPLIIPDVSGRKYINLSDSSGKSENKNRHYSYPFFRIGDKHVVSGSEIRGMIRSVYETVTDSCYSTAKKTALSMRTHDFGSDAGLLVKTGKEYVLFEADAVCIDTGINPKPKGKYPKPSGLDKFRIEGTRLVPDKSIKEYYDYGSYENFSEIIISWFGVKKGNDELKWVGENNDDNKYRLREAEQTGYLLMVPWNKKGTKRYDHVMIKKEKKIESLPVDDVLLKLEKQINDYLDNGGDEKRFLDMRSKIRKKPDYIPIWYRKKDKKDNGIYLSFSRQGRMEFINDFYDMLKPFNAVPCKCGEQLCPACSLFGYAADERSSVSRVRVSDAVETGKSVFSSKHILAELSSPKISSTEFYLKSVQGEDFWDYDTPGTEIRGRKFYWHHKPNSASETDKETKRNATHEICKEGRFEFKLYFDRINENELETLKWLLCLGENNSEGKYQHKLGHGKPLGFGSVKITVDKETVRVISGDNYELKENKNPVITDMSAQLNAAPLLTICDSERFSPEEQKLIKYPIAEDMSAVSNENSAASHQWFLGNRSRDGKSGLSNPHINYKLAGYNEKNQTLPKWIRK